MSASCLFCVPQFFLRGIESARIEDGITPKQPAKSGFSSLVVPLIIGGIVCFFLSLALIVYWRRNIRKRLIIEGRDLNVAASKTIPDYHSQKASLGSILGHSGHSDTSQALTSNTKLVTEVSIGSENSDWTVSEQQLIEPSPDISKKLEQIKDSLLSKGRSFNGLLSFNSCSEQTIHPVDVPTGTTIAGKLFQLPLAAPLAARKSTKKTLHLY